ELGRIDVRLKMDGDKVSVQLVPSSAVGREMISQTIDKLRIELSSAYGEVNVSLGESSHDQSGGSQSSLEGEGLFMADSSLSAGGEQSTQSSESQSRSSSLGTA
ncbi:flagellar hook-length control protein FliK, partial [Vibrio sp. 10N.222.49.C9]